MPSILILLGYRVYFWVDDYKEPIHVQIGKGRPKGNDTKIWITSYGGTLLAHNKGRIPKKDLKRLLRMIEIYTNDIYNEWVELFGEEPKFYC